MLLLATLLAISPPPEPPARLVERRVAVMGTLLRVETEAATRDEALTAGEAALRRIEEAEALLSTWREATPLARLNEASPGVPRPAPPDLVSALDELFSLSARTDGAFAPGILPLVRAWGLRGGGRSPGIEEIVAARRASAPGGFAIDRVASTVTRLRGDAALDEGGWAKGWALDRAADPLRAVGISALLDLGGQLLVTGAPRAVGIAHPKDRGRTLLTIRIHDASAATSGDGERPGHLLDPRTGRPARDFGSVTVVSSSAFVADVLSTALFVLGPEKGLALSVRLNREGIPNDALFAVLDGNHITCICTEGFRSLVIEGEALCPH